MAEKLSANAAALLLEPNIVHLATLMADGSPQVTPVWVDYDGTHILVNTALGRVKARNLERDERVALSVTDRNSASRTVSVRGRVVEITEEGALDHINKLAKKYRGTDHYSGPVTERRIIVRIEPVRVLERGLDR